MNEQPKSDLLSFLAEEMKGYGIVTSDVVSSQTNHGWSLQRDDAGFTVTTTPDAFPSLKLYLESLFSKPKFDSTNTLIFRNDEKQTTVMLSGAADQTQLIVLFWRDPAIRSRIVAAQSDALTEVINRAVADIHESFNDALNEANDLDRSTKLDGALKKAQELFSGFESMSDEPDK
jgi:hypothetical protein